MTKLRPLLIIGTRPEAIKMAPVVHQCKTHPQIDPIVCFSGQHRELLTGVTDYFGIQADMNLDLMKSNQSLSELTARCVMGIDEVLVNQKPDCIVVQGDTTTVMAASLAAFYRNVPCVHVEAGLRTGNLFAPWPEEMNRRVAGIVASLHCAPTSGAAEQLLAENVPSAQVRVTGNTVIDALLWTIQRERSNNATWEKKYDFLGSSRMVLITGHRRENFGQGFQDLCRAIAELAHRFEDVQFVYPVHLNPQVQEPVNNLLGELPNVNLIAPAAYPEFVWMMDRSTIILTDSGGVQEEAPSLKKPVLCMRETTERPEAVDAGAVQLVGTSYDRIVDSATSLLSDDAVYAKHQIDENPYGDGKAAQRIVEFILEQGWQA